MNAIPKLLKYEKFPGFFMILPKTKIHIFPYNPILIRTAKILSSKIYNLSKINLPIIENKEFDSFTINILLTKSDLEKNNYRLNINARYIQLEAIDEIGLFYGIKTLLKLVFKNPKYSSYLMLETCKIEGEPYPNK